MRQNAHGPIQIKHTMGEMLRIGFWGIAVHVEELCDVHVNGGPVRERTTADVQTFVCHAARVKLVGRQAEVGRVRPSGTEPLEGVRLAWTVTYARRI